MIHAVLAFLHGDHCLDITGLFEYPLLGFRKTYHQAVDPDISQ